jgi:pimeloyl-ACP methyl ester carboxylesterase
MKLQGPAVWVTIFVGKDDTWHRKPLYTELMHRAHRSGLAGASVVRGIEGYDASSRIPTTRLLSLSEEDGTPFYRLIVQAQASSWCPIYRLGPHDRQADHAHGIGAINVPAIAIISTINTTQDRIVLANRPLWRSQSDRPYGGRSGLEGGEMRRYLRAIGLLAVMVWMSLIAACGSPTGPGVPGVDTVAREPLTLNFGDFTSHAQLTYPAHDPSPRPAVLLIHGAGPEDLNATISSFSGQPLSSIFSQIADYLSARGYAVLRYDKHYVTGPYKADPKLFTTGLDIFARDAETALHSIQANPHVDPRRISIYGWSEGSTIAAELAVTHPELAALVVQGPVATSWHDVFAYQLREVVVPYARALVPDGRITTDTLHRALTGPGGKVAQGVLLANFSDLATATRTDQLAINPALDTNHDGVIDLDTEFIPRIDALIDSLLSPEGYLAAYGPGRALPTVGEQAPRLRLPVLILQGDRDANVAPAGARRLDAALTNSPPHTLRSYPNLGHSLGPATSVIDDNFRPMATQPLTDLTTWLHNLPAHR